MTHRNRPEEALQRAVASYLDLALPDDVVWHHSPNGGARSKAEGGVFKAMGTRPGWPDIEIISRGFAGHGRAYFIELKAPNGRLSPNQKTCHAVLQKTGAPVAVCQRVEEVEGTLRGWGFDLRATTGARAA